MRPRELCREILGVVVLGIGALLVLALASFDVADLPERVFPANSPPRNWAGITGARLAFGLLSWVGTLGAVGTTAAVLALGVSLLGRRDPVEPEARADLWRRIVGAFLVVLVLSVVERTVTGRLLPALSGRLPGGFWGELLAFELGRRLEGPGAAVAIASAALVGLVLLADQPLAKVLGLPVAEAAGAASRLAAATEADAALLQEPAPMPFLEPRDEPEDDEPEADPLLDEVLKEQAPAAPAPETKPRGILDTLNALGGEQGRALGEAAKAAAAAKAKELAVAAGRIAADQAVELAGAVATSIANAVIPPQRVEAPKPAPKPAPAPAPAPAPVRDATAPRLPPIDLLTAPAAATPQDQGALGDRARRIEDVLSQFKVEARIAQVERGPNVTLFALELGKGVKVARVASLLDNLALALRVPGGIRIQAPIPGTSWVGLEVPNEDQDTVALRELIENPVWARKDPALPIFLGKDTAGRPLIADLSKMPHLLIAGSTGSGKSVCLNTILVSLLATRGPREVKLILIDPKQVELAQFAKVPHLLTPVVTDMHKAGAVLDWAVKKMEERYGLLAKVGVRHVREYDALGKEEIARRLGTTPDRLEETRTPWRLGYLVVVVDELGDLMMVAQKEVEASITRLAQKARAVGIHVVLATQRPSVDVITGVIKANLPARIAFQVTSKVDSRTILDGAGAEKLLGQGDMLFQPPGRNAPIRAKGAYVSDHEIEAVVAFLAREAQPEFLEELARCAPAKRTRGGASSQQADDDGDDAKRDEVYEAAVRVVLAEGKGSVSLLQRKLEIGYGRAARFVDMMEEDSIVGPANGSKPREIKTTLERWEAMIAARKAGGERAAA